MLPTGAKGVIWVQQIFVDNTLQFLGIAPTFALYPQKLGPKRLKFYFRPQPVDNPVDTSFFGFYGFKKVRGSNGATRG
jgi:hypothetical protein